MDTEVVVIAAKAYRTFQWQSNCIVASQYLSSIRASQVNMELRPLSADLQKIACDELHENPNRIQNDLETIKTWIRQQPHLKARTDDQWLIAFLRGCKYSLERTKAKLDQYYTMKTKFPEMFKCTDVDDPQLRALLHEGMLVALPTPLHGNGPRIMMMRNGIVPVGKYSLELVTRLASATQQITLLEDDYANINGLLVIMDAAGASTSHFMQWTPSIIKKTLVYTEEALPFRQKGQHFINTVSALESLFNILKPMLPKKQQDRIFLHSKSESFHKLVPKKYLPKEYGGENGSIAEITAAMDKKLDFYRDYFKDEANYGTNENLRPGKPIDFERMFGMEGSFRKLDVD